MNIQELRDRYRENEAHNFHTENLLLLAENFGTDEQVQEVKRKLSTDGIDYVGKRHLIPRHIAGEISALYYTHLVSNRT